MVLLNTNWSNAFVVMGVGMLIVFAVLILLVILLTISGSFFAKSSKSSSPTAAPKLAAVPVSAGIPAGEQAAIAAALHLLYDEAHDEESYVITIDEHRSSWNSKLLTSNLE